LFNIQLPANFNNPLHAANMADFFVRWQITLSKWLYDYVYRPLGGSRKSLWRTMLNVFITLLIAGLWHGAGVTYVVLGLFYGSCVALYHAYRRVRKAVLKQYDRQFIENPVYKRLTHVLTFVLIVISGILFRSPNLQTEGIFLSRLARLDDFAADVVHQISIGDWTPIVLFLLMPAIALSGPVVVKLYQRLFNPMPYWFKVQTATAAVTLCWIMSGSETPPFIYFQF
jgi:alginate O-acetyltransferase complex protein AlgI